MFGGGGFGSNNNNHNTGGGIFGGGGGGGFGQQNNTQNTGFGAQPNTAFGQPAQQNTGGGMFGQANNTQSSGFGFGQSAQQPQQNNAFGGGAAARPGFGATGGSTFGQPANNNTGGGMFGATTSTFGQQNNTANTGGMFGAARPAGNTGMGGFGSGSTSTLFGAKPATNTFGAQQNNNLQPNQVQPYTAGPDWPPIPQTGTSNPQYFPTWQQDPNASGTGPSTAPPHLFHAISAMPPYRGASFEELRLMDYQQGRKDAGVQGANAAGGFGATNTASTGFGTGSTGGFGAPANTGTPGAFGAGATNNAFGAPKPGGLFGSSGTTTGGFGSTSTTTGGGLFGQNNSQPAAGGFGSTSNTGGGLFGGQTQQQPAAGGGLFGNTNPFGANNNQQQQQQQPASTGFSFGAKPATTGFGATPSTGTGAFGAPAPATGGFGQTNTTGSTGFGGFGQQNQQQQQQPAATGGLFGGGGGFGTNTTQPAQGTTGGLFGSNNNTQQPSTGGLFGSTAPKPAGGLFGSTTTPATGSTGFGGFGQTAAQPAAPATNTGLGGLFGGGNNTTTTNTGGGLFGQQNQQQPAQQPAATGGLFGGGGTSSLFGKPATPAGQTGGLFGSTQPAQPAAPTGGLFGGGATSTTGGGLFGSSTAAPAQGQQQSTGGLFGGGGGLFGQQNQQTQQPAATGTTGSLFGGGLGTSGGLFGGQQQQQPAQQPAGSSLFSGFGGGLGQSTAQQQQQQPSLVASIDQNPYGSSPLFQTPGIQLQPVVSTKKAALPPALNSSFRVTPNRSQINKLRGFASPLAGSYSPARAGSVIGSPRAGAASPRVVPGSPAMSDRYKGLSDMALSPHAFIPRENIKRLSIGNKGLGSIGSENPEEALLGKSLRKAPTPSRESQNGENELTPNGSNGLVFNQSRPEAASHRRNGSERDVFASSPSAPVVGTEKLRKGEYWCKPRLERLKQMTQAELRSVNHFTVGCKGKGEVTFSEPVDLTGLDLNSLLGEIVTFGNSEMTIYCDGRPKDEKPPPGSGLNHPAAITLEGVWAVDKASKKPIRDEKDPRLVKFVKRLRAVGKFVDYEVENGVWTFEVEHFSRWGVPDSSDEEDDGHWEVDEVQRRRGQSASSGEDIRVEQERTDDEAATEEDEEDDDDEFMPPTRGLRDSADASEGAMTDEDAESVSDEAASSHSSGSARSVHAPPNALSGDAIADRLGEDGARKIRAMQSDLFGDRSAPRYTGIDVRREKDALMGLKRTLREKGFELAEEEDDATHDDRAVKRASFGEQLESPRIQVQPRKYARVALEKSTVEGHEGVRVDAGLALGRAFRCSWGPDGELVHFGRICKPTAEFVNGSSADVFIENLGLLAHEVPTEVERANRLLDLHLERTRVAVLDGIPVASLDETIRFGDFTKLFEGGNRSHEANVWRLGVALFDEIDLRLPASATEETVERISAIRRKLALSKWLENAVTPLVDHDLVAASTDAPLKVFTYLSGNQLGQAVQAAIDAGDMRLATLVSQLGCPENVREEVMRQLEDWHKYKNNSVLADGYRRLYALFAGIMDVVPGDSSRGVDRSADVIVSSGLDWKRAFGLRLWYGNPADHSVSDVLATYAQDLRAEHAPAKPLPAYMEKPAPLAKEWTMVSEPTDVLYGLIKLYSDVTVSLDDVLRARDCSPSPLDARLQWHLALLLSQALRKRDFADRTDEGHSAQADGITAGYAAQLEESGQWTRAAFVLLHLQTIDGRADAIKALLHRHPNPTDEERSFLLRRCQVPQTWLHEAKAAELASEDDAFGEFKALLQAELYDRAHRILKDKLAIEAILRGDDGLLKKLCLLFEGREPPEWEYGGQLFLDYIETKVELPQIYASVLRAGPGADPTQIAESHRLLGNVSRLIQLLPALFPDVHDPRQSAALSDMLSTLAGLEASLNGREARGGKGRMVPGDRLAILQSVAVQDFERSVAVLA